jgi:3-oxoacyl-[acyl-carrier-protein] synthase III
MQPRARILGTGHYVPPRVVTNADLEERLETTHDWIVQRTGIHERRFVDPGVGTADLGVEAAKQALDAAGIGPEDVDFIIFATLSPDFTFPGSAVFVQEKLGCGNIGALDVRNQCTGFLYALGIADSFVRTGQYKRILVIGAEVHSTGLDFSKRGRDVTVIFGDGAGAAVVGPGENENTGILSTRLHAEGKHAKRLWCELPGSFYHDRFGEKEWWGEEGRQYPKMDGRYVFMHALTRLPETIRDTLALHQLTLDDIDILVPHQANLRINQKVAEILDLPMEKVVNNIDRYGNTTAGSIPIAMDEAVRDGRIAPGKLVMLAGFGAGFTWGSALIRW